jgi:hypothetical protein
MRPFALSRVASLRNRPPFDTTVDATVRVIDDIAYATVVAAAAVRSMRRVLSAA